MTNLFEMFLLLSQNDFICQDNANSEFSQIYPTIRQPVDRIDSMGHPSTKQIFHFSMGLLIKAMNIVRWLSIPKNNYYSKMFIHQIDQAQLIDAKLHSPVITLKFVVCLTVIDELNVMFITQFHELI